MGDVLLGLITGLFTPELAPPGSEKAARARAGFQLVVALLWLIGAGALVYFALRTDESGQRAFLFFGAVVLVSMAGLFWYMARRTILDRRV